MDKEMHGILYNTQSTDEIKWKMYSQTLHKYLHVVKEKDKAIEIPIMGSNTETVPSSVKDVPAESPSLISPQDAQVIHLLKKALPKTMKDKGIELLNILMAGPIVSWNAMGEINVNGKNIKNSNIVDLICNAVRSKNTAKPTGWQEFAKAVVDSNVPHEFVGKNIEVAYLNANASDPLTPQPSTSKTPVLSSVGLRKKRPTAPYARTWSKFKL